VAPLTEFVSAVSPAPNVVGAGRADPLELTLTQPLSVEDFRPASLSVFGRWSGVARGEVTLEGGGLTIRFAPAAPFQAGEWVSASLEAGVSLADGSPMEKGFSWGFWVAPSAGSLDMIELGERILLDENEGHVQPYGAYAGDYNGDGYPDLAIPNEITADVRIMLNDGTGNYEQFSVLEIPDGAWPSPNEGADFNGDGITDLVVGNAQNDLVSLFAGDGKGSFTSIGGFSAGRNVRGVCPADFNHDGWPDVATVNMSEGPRETRGNVAMLLNTADGSGRLERTAQIASPGNAEKTCATGDMNGDGHVDLAVGAWRSDEVIVFLGDGAGGLALHGTWAAGGQPWMIVTGDMNGDGHVDVVAANREGDN
ncbi:MAG: VCBS repeat-containing protein, partial [Gemmatimonadota bacterium]